MVAVAESACAQAITALTPGRAKLVVVAYALIYVVAFVGLVAFIGMASSMTPSMTRAVS